MGIIDFLFPILCLECKREGNYICPTCLSKLPSLKQICPICKRASVDGFTHLKCQKKFGINGLICIWPYSGVVRKAILALKYKHVSEIENDLSVLALKRLREIPLLQERGGMLTTVPIFWTRKNFRGYNQVDEIGRFLAKSFNLIFYDNLLIRKKLKSPQAMLSKEERIKNIKGAFVINPKHKETVKVSKTIFVVDDVYTTGSTLKEAAKVLKRKGATNIWGVTIAR